MVIYILNKGSTMSPVDNLYTLIGDWLTKGLQLDPVDKNGLKTEPHSSIIRMLTSTLMNLPPRSLNPTSNFVVLKNFVYPLTLHRHWLSSQRYALPGVTRRIWTMVRSSLTPKTLHLPNCAQSPLLTESSHEHTDQVLLKVILLRYLPYNVDLNYNVRLLILMIFTSNLCFKRLQNPFTTLYSKIILLALLPTLFELEHVFFYISMVLIPTQSSLAYAGAQTHSNAAYATSMIQLNSIKTFYATINYL